MRADDSLEPLWLAMAEKQRRKAQDGPERRSAPVSFDFEGIYCRMADKAAGLPVRKAPAAPRPFKGTLRRGKCRNGHVLTPQTVYASGKCKACHRTTEMRFQARRKRQSVETTSGTLRAQNYSIAEPRSKDGSETGLLKRRYST